MLNAAIDAHLASLREEMISSRDRNAIRAMEIDAKYGGILYVKGYKDGEEVTVSGRKKSRTYRFLLHLERAFQREHPEFVGQYRHLIGGGDTREFWVWACFAKGVTIPNTSWCDEICSSGHQLELTIRKRTYLVHYSSWDVNR